MKLRIIIVVILCTYVLFGCFIKGDFQNVNSNKATVLIDGSYVPPKSLNQEKTLVWSDSTEGEFVEIIVKGEIKNFEIVSLTWNENKSALEEVESLLYLDSLVDQTIVLKTILPCGMPSRKIKWEQISGVEETYLITDNNLLGD